MTTNRDQILAAAIQAYLDSCPKQLEFPLGGNLVIPTDAELQLLEAIGGLMPITQNEIAVIRSQLDMDDSYDLLIFAVRMGVLAARTNTPRTLLLSLVGLVIDNSLDFRDVLTALSIMENCATRLGIDFCKTTQDLRSLASDRRWKTIGEGYCARERAWREIGIFGFTTTGAGDTLNFLPKE
jgi:hypothetical protein